MNNKLKISLASMLLCTSLFAGEFIADGTNSGDSASNHGDFFVGGTYGGGFGSVKLSTDGSKYKFVDSDDVSSFDLNLYVGYQNIYLFYQRGTVKTSTVDFNDLDYSTFGFGYLYKMEKFKKDFEVVSVTPEYDVKIGYNLMTEETTNDNLLGLLVGFDVGLSASPTALENLDITVGLGYDFHAVNNAQSINRNGTWNFSSLNFNIGARYKF